MKKLTKESFEKAKDWIQENGRPLEKALLKFHFYGDSYQGVVDALKAFQNDDGGFGNSIEPDLRSPSSSVLGTSLAFQTLREIQVDHSHDLVQSGIQFLLKNYDENDQSWRIIPSVAENFPHAPWWNQKGRENLFEGFHLNPTTEILGYLYDYADFVENKLIDELTSKVLGKLSQLAEIEMHDFLCCKRLLESSNLDQTSRQKLLAELSRVVEPCVVKDPAAWTGYGLKPIQVADSLDSPFINMFQASVTENLDYEIEIQSAKGVWVPTWSWQDDYPDEWEKAKIEWTGIITLERLLLLDRFQRLEK